MATEQEGFRATPHSAGPGEGSTPQTASSHSFPKACSPTPNPRPPPSFGPRQLCLCTRCLCFQRISFHFAK